MKTFICFLISFIFVSGLYSQAITPAGPINLCQGSNQVLTVTPPATTYQWQLNAVNIPGATLISYTVTSASPGSFTVILNGGANPGDTLGPVVVSIIPKPVPSFTFTPNNTCANTPVYFTNTSTGTGLTYLWNFGDLNSGANNTSTATNPVHNFIGNPGTGSQNYIVKLVVTGSNGCKDSVEIIASYLQRPGTQLNGAGSTISTIYNGLPYFSVCTTNPTAVLTFTNNSSTQPNLHYRIYWFNDPLNPFDSPVFSTPVNHTFNRGIDSFLFIVSGSAPNFCIDTAKYYVFVGSNPTGGLSNPGGTNFGCMGDSFTFPFDPIVQNNPPGTDYYISVNDGSPIVHYTQANLPLGFTHLFDSTSCGIAPNNTFTISYFISNPCGETPGSIGGIRISRKAVAAFSILPKDTVCQNTIVTFTNTGSSGSSAPSSGSGPCVPGKSLWQITPSTPGAWTLQPGSTLGSDNGTPLNPVIWTSGTNLIRILFNTPGSYSIKLKSGALCGDNPWVDSITKIICVNPTPIASFTVDQNTGCAPFTVNTTNTSSPAPFCGQYTYNWSVTYAATTGCSPSTNGAVFNPSAVNPQFQFNNPGIYTIRLIAIAPAAACSSVVATQQITVKGKPTFTINAAASVCVNQCVTPTQNSTCYINASTTYAWSFPGGNPSTSNLPNPGCILYPNSGNYTITLSVTNECGTTTVSNPITVNQTPAAVVPGNITVCAGTTVGPLTLSSLPTGATITWTNSNTGIGLLLASGPGNIPSFTATNAGTTPISATITVRAQTGICFSFNTFTITVNPAPTVNAVTNKIFCAGTSTPIINFTGNLPTAYYDWTNSNPAIGLAASGSGNIASFVAANPGTTPIIATITVTPKDTSNNISCPGTPRTFTITVNPTPTVNSVTSQTVCAGASTTAIVFNGTIPGTVYRWTNSNPAIGLVAGPLNGNIASFTATNPGTTPITGTIIVTPTYTSGGQPCPGTPTTFTITVNPSPSVNTVTDKVYCAGTSTPIINFTGNLPTAYYDWINSNPAIGLAASGTGDIASFVAANPGTTPIIATITVTPKDTSNNISCSGTPRIFTITVNPTPTVNAVASQTVCAGTATAAIIFSGAVPGTVYSWINSNPAIGLNAGPLNGNIASFTATNPGTTPITGTITVTPGYGTLPCTGTPITFTITVNPAPTVNAVANQTVCAGSPTSAINFTGNIAGAVYNWTNSNTAIGLGAGNSGDIPSFIATNIGTTPITGTITVTPEYNNNSVTCFGTPRIFTITVNPAPTVNTVTNKTFCPGTLTPVINFTGAVAGTNYNWTNSNTAIGLGPGSTGSIPSFTATNPGTTPITGTITVTPNYTNNSVTCSGTPTTFTITINPTPTVNAVNNLVFCTGSLTSVINFTGAVAGTVYNWSNNNISIGLGGGAPGDIPAFTATNTTAVPITGTITVTPTYTNNGVTCTGPPISFTITVNPKPAITNKVDTICSGSSFTVTPLNGGGDIVPAATTYSWGIPAVTGGLMGGTAGTNQTSIGGTLINPTNLAQTATYTVTPTSGAGGNCVGATFTVTVTVNPRPFVQNDSASICSENAFTVTPSNATPGNIIPAGTLYTWTNPTPPPGPITGGSAQPIGQTSISQTLTNITNLPATLTYTVTPSSGGNCTGLPFTIVVTVKPKPQLTSPVNPPAVCTNTLFSYLATSSTANTSFSWIRPPVAGITPATNSDIVPSISETLSNSTYSPITVVYNFSMIDNGCTNAQAVSLVVNPDAKSAFVTDTTIGCVPFNINQHLTVTRYPNANDETQYKWYANGFGNLIGTGLAVPNYSITVPGSIVTITLVAKSKYGCKDDTSSLILRTVERPVPSFTKTVDSACGPVIVTFTNTTTPITVLNGSSYLWTFGNGISSPLVQPAPVTFFPSPIFRDTVYIVTLRVITACDTLLKFDSVRVYANPKARFTTIPTGCSPFRDTIVNNSFGQDAFTTYFWDFGDGNTTVTNTTGNVYHTYNVGTITTFTIRLIMENRCSRDTQYSNIVVSPLNIQANIAVNGSDLFGCRPHAACFQNSSVGASFLIVNYGDGSTLDTIPNSQSIFCHTFNIAGTYNVQVKLKNNCTDTTVIRQITVYEKPLAAFTLIKSLICTGETVVTNNTSTNANSYEWFWGDGTSTSSFNASHIYPAAGIYQVRLVVRRVNAFGIVCTDTSAAVTVTVVERIPSVVLLNPTSLPCIPYTVNVVASNAATAAQVDWYFYDSTVAPGIFYISGPQATYTYNSPGIYTIKLVVTNIAGCKDSSTRQITVSKKPDVVFTPLNVLTCNADTTINFNLTVNAHGANPVSFDWYINNQFSGNGNPFSKRFTVPAGIPATNVFDIKVFVRNVFGCGDTVVIGNLTIKTIAARRITVSPALVQTQPDMTFTFSDTATALPNSLYTWNPGDRNGQQLSGKSITYTYGDTGTYHVKMLVHDYASGCVFRDSVKVYVLHVPGYLYVANAFCPGCSKAELRQFLPLGKGLKDYHLVIYNIWGQKVFETKRLDANGSPSEPWNGNWPGSNLNTKQGAYSWQIRAHYVNGGEWKGMTDPKTGKLHKQGFITILR